MQFNAGSNGEFSQVNLNPHIARSYAFGTWPKDPNYELEENQSFLKLQRIANKMFKNNIVAATAQQHFINNISGEGFAVRLSSVSDLAQPSKVKRLQGLVRDRLKCIDRNETLSLEMLVEQIVGAMFGMGDVLVNISAREFDPSQPSLPLTMVELVDSSRVETPLELQKDPNVVLGVQLENGAEVGYYVRKPSKYGAGGWATNSKLEAFDYLPAFKDLVDPNSGKTVRRRVSWLVKAPVSARPGSVRQYPLITPSMDMIRYLDALLEARLIRDRVAASFSVVITGKNPAGTKQNIEGNSQERLVAIGKIDPGTIFYGGQSDSVTALDPSPRGDNGDAMIQRILGLISAQMTIPYDMMFMDLSRINYSSWKGGSIAVRRTLNRWWRVLNPVLESVVNAVLWELYLTGQTTLHPSKLRVLVEKPVFESVDEEKIARADKISVAQVGSKSIQDVCRASGKDYEVLIQERGEEALDKARMDAEVLRAKKELEEQYGILFPDVVHETESDLADDSVNKTGTEGADPEDRDTSSSRRPGESEGRDLDEEDARERRVEDGNY